MIPVASLVMKGLIVPAALALLAGGEPADSEPAILRTAEEVRAALEVLKAESAPSPEARALIARWEEWRDSPWRGGRFGVDPLPAQDISLQKDDTDQGRI